jgi:hypothetical protein
VVWSLTAGLADPGINAARAAIVVEAETRLSRLGMTPERIADVLSGLRREFRDPPGQPVVVGVGPRSDGPLDATVESGQLMGILGSIVHLGHVFRVFDCGNNTTHFLRVAAFHPRNDRIGFENFTGDRVCHMSGVQFAADVAVRRSEPADSEASIGDAVELFGDFDFSRVRQAPPVWSRR